MAMQLLTVRIRRKTHSHREFRARIALCVRCPLSDVGPFSAYRELIARQCSALPDLDPRSPDEILGYDDEGAP